MSLAVGAPSSCSKDMGFDENKAIPDKNGSFDAKNGDDASEGEECRHHRTVSEASPYATEEEEEDDEGKAAKMIDLGPQVSIRHHMEKDKDDESLRRWKEQLLGSVDLNSVGETLEPDVNILSLSILSPGRADIVLPISVGFNPKGVWFTLKEDSHYKLKFSFSVSNNIVSGLRYTNTVWKTGVKVDSAKAMLGTFSPQSEPYVYETPEETTPSGLFARGSYSAKQGLLTMMANATWRSITPLTFAKNGRRLPAETTPIPPRRQNSRSLFRNFSAKIRSHRESNI